MMVRMNPYPQGEDPDQPLTAKVYRELRNRIIAGELAPGARLRERDLAHDLGVSRIPVRQALPQLEAEGFITTRPRRGATVTQLTMRDIDELFDVRLGVEVSATRMAARRVASGVDPACLRRAISEADAALASGDPTWIAESNADLHEAIVLLADNVLLATMTRSIAGRDRWVFRMTSDRDQAAACHEHHELCDAIYAGNEEFAAAISYAHIERGRKPTVDTLRTILPGPGPIA
jgi:DNA-binding GntR family transcriptional regulator